MSVWPGVDPDFLGDQAHERLSGLWVFKDDAIFRWRNTLREDLEVRLLQCDVSAWAQFIEHIEQVISERRREPE